MKYKHLPRNENLKPYSTKLRKNATPEENHLWYDYLRTYPIRFNRQRIIGNYIADFYCDRVKLVIEIDGEQHYSEAGEAYDTKRTTYLAEHGIWVLRFFNSEVNRDFEMVCRTIDGTVLELLEGKQPFVMVACSTVF